VLFEATGVFPDGAVRYFGSAEQITALAADEEFLRLILQGQLNLFGFGFRRFVTGEEMMHAVGQAAEAIDAL
jgi:hypothetical protein